MKKSSNVLSTVFLILALLFVGYGAYALANAVEYINTYTAPATMTSAGRIQYIINSSASYFGFGLIMLGIFFVLKKINTAINEIYKISSNPSDAPSSTAAPATTVAAEAIAINAEADTHKDVANMANVTETVTSKANEAVETTDIAKATDVVDAAEAIQATVSEAAAQDDSKEEESEDAQFQVEYIYEEDLPENTIISEIINAIEANSETAQEAAPEATKPKASSQSNPKLVSITKEAEISSDFDELIKSLYK